MSCSFVFDPLCSCIFEQDVTHGFHSLSLTKDELSRHNISEEVSKTLFHSTDSSYSLAYIPDFRVYDFFHPVGNKSFPSKCKRGETVIINMKQDGRCNNISELLFSKKPKFLDIKLLTRIKLIILLDSPY